MRVTYSVIYIVMILAAALCTIFAKLSSKPIKGSVAWVENSIITPILGSLIMLLATDKTLALIGNYIYFIGVDLALFALVSFTNVYCSGVGKGTHKPTVMYIALSADVIQILLNPFIKHAFDVQSVIDDGEIYYKLQPFFGQTIHRIVDYFVFFCVLMILTLSTVKTPKVYRERFLMLLISLILVGIWQAYYIISRSVIDRAVLGYGFFGLVIFYFAIIYRPLRLLDQMLSNIVSDLSDAFYVFDPTGNCIWANEQGCKLVGFSGTNYEEINEGLRRMFGSLTVGDSKTLKVTVKYEDSVKFYSLEEKQVKGTKGRRDGSYLRIQDVTEEEHELQLRDEQIGQISQEAYKDALTSVGNKAAYDNMISELIEQIKNGMTDFAVVMADMNNLKGINDEYGHRSGDMYIKGCCRMICEVFKFSPVFRIGGDEFVAILRGQDFQTREQKFQSLRDAFRESCEKPDTDPWLRYSAAVGMAEYADDDSTFEDVFKRADTAMYEDKKRFKAQHGSYRVQQ